VAISGLGAPGHVFLASMLTYVGLNPHTGCPLGHAFFFRFAATLAEKDRRVYDCPTGFAGVTDKQIGHVVVNNTIDRLVAILQLHGRRKPRVCQKNPVATKRAMRRS